MTSPPFLRAVPGTAAEWFAARRGPHDAEMERRFSQWLKADPRNAEEYALCEMTWELSAMAVEAEPANANAAARGGESNAAFIREDEWGASPENRGARSRWFSPRGMAGLLGVAASAALVAVILLWQAAPKQTQTWQTAPGEQRAITLADGTRITLNTRSSLEARLSPSAREVRLLRGEAFFDVAKDAKRPFVVATALGKARVMGTRFDVLFEAERVEVATQTGSVLVSSLDGRAPDVLASAGLRATIVRGGAGPTLGRADLARIENWRAQRLEFDRVPLEEALREFSRYTARPIKAATPEIGQIRVSAVLRTGDVDALRATLQAAFGLTILEGRDASLVSAAPPNER